MHLPELSFIDGAYHRVGSDVGDDNVNVPTCAVATGVRHEEDTAERGAERDAEAEHRNGEGCSQGAVKIDTGRGREEWEKEDCTGTGKGEEVGGIAEDGR